MVFNQGNVSLDFTYINNIIKGVDNILLKSYIYKLYNTENIQPVRLLDLIEVIEKYTGKTANQKMILMKPSYISHFWASIDRLKNDYNMNYQSTEIEKNIEALVLWSKSYYK